MGINWAEIKGPASATDNALSKFDGTTGKLIQNTVVTADDAGTVNIPTGQTYNIAGAPHSHAGTGGDVVGPASATDNALPKFDGTTGRLIQNTVVTADDSGTVNIPTGQTYNIAGAPHNHAGSGGDVVGPASATDNALSKFDGTTGKLIQNTVVTADDSGTVNIPTGQTYNIAGAPHSHAGSGGNVVGPASATDANLTSFDGTTGKLIKDSSISQASVSAAVSASHAAVHAASHVNGTDDIQSATAAQKGLMTLTYAGKLDGIEALADVTDATNVASAGAIMTSTPTIDITGTEVTVTNKNKHKDYLKDSVDALALFNRGTFYWNGSSFVADFSNGFGYYALQNNSGSNSNGFGYYALQNNTGSNSNGFGNYALQYNSGAYSNGFGNSALYGNSGSNSNGFGYNALYSNSGSNSNGFGYYSLQYNTGSNSNGFGYYALYNNTGTSSNGFGYSALSSNTGSSSNGFGYAALQNNTGTSSNGFGYYALYNNTGSSSNGFGYYALRSNTGSYSNGFGNSALYSNSGTYSNGFGNSALYYNTGTDSNGFGYSVLRYNTGSYSNGFGNSALYYNTGSSSNGFGYNRLYYNNWPNIISIGHVTTPLFSIDATTEKAFASADINATAHTITFGAAHGFGTTGTKVNLQYQTVTGSAPTGLVHLSIYQFTITSTTILTLDAITSVGAGTFKLTKDYDLTNSISIGTDIAANKANQVVLGNDSIVETLLKGNVGLGGTPNVNILLDVISTTKAFRPPVMTTTQKNAIPTPVEGMLIYDVTLHKMCVFGAAAWETITSV